MSQIVTKRSYVSYRNLIERSEGLGEVVELTAEEIKKAAEGKFLTKLLLPIFDCKM